jgi:hypothetical protein
MNAAYAYKQVGDFSKAIDLYNKFISEYGSEERLSALQKGDRRRRRGPDPKKYAERLKYFNDAYDALGTTYYGFFNYQRAAETYEKIATTAASRREAPRRREERDGALHEHGPAREDVGQYRMKLSLNAVEEKANADYLSPSTTASSGTPRAPTRARTASTASTPRRQPVALLQTYRSSAAGASSTWSRRALGHPHDARPTTSRWPQRWRRSRSLGLGTTSAEEGRQERSERAVSFLGLRRRVRLRAHRRADQARVRHRSPQVQGRGARRDRRRQGQEGRVTRRTPRRPTSGTRSSTASSGPTSLSSGSPPCLGAPGRHLRHAPHGPLQPRPAAAEVLHRRSRRRTLSQMEDSGRPELEDKAAELRDHIKEDWRSKKEKELAGSDSSWSATTPHPSRSPGSTTCERPGAEGRSRRLAYFTDIIGDAKMREHVTATADRGRSRRPKKLDYKDGHVRPDAPGLTAVPPPNGSTVPPLPVRPASIARPRGPLRSSDVLLAPFAAAPLVTVVSGPGCGGDGQARQLPDGRRRRAHGDRRRTAPRSASPTASTSGLTGAATRAYERGWQAWLAGNLEEAKNASGGRRPPIPSPPAPHYSLGVVLERLGDALRRAAGVPRGVHQAGARAVHGRVRAVARRERARRRGRHVLHESKRAKYPKSARLMTFPPRSSRSQKDHGTAQQLAQTRCASTRTTKPAMVTIARDHYRARKCRARAYALRPSSKASATPTLRATRRTPRRTFSRAHPPRGRRALDGPQRLRGRRRRSAPTWSRRSSTSGPCGSRQATRRRRWPRSRAPRNTPRSTRSRTSTSATPTAPARAPRRGKRELEQALAARLQARKSPTTISGSSTSSRRACRECPRRRRRGRRSRSSRRTERCGGPRPRRCQRRRRRASQPRQGEAGRDQERRRLRPPSRPSPRPGRRSSCDAGSAARPQRRRRRKVTRPRFAPLDSR